MSLTPPLGGNAPPLQCNRLMGGTFDEPELCGKPGAWHVIWDLDLNNGICCDEHAEEARRLWVFIGFHPYSEVCSIGGARWLPDKDICVVDDDDLGLAIGGVVSIDRVLLVGEGT